MRQPFWAPFSRRIRVSLRVSMSAIPGMPVSRGLVSGITSMRPSSDATRCAPALTVKFSAVQVRPDRYQSTGTGPFSACGGRYTANVIVPLQTCEACL